jgi:hypothetical protein
LLLGASVRPPLLWSGDVIEEELALADLGRALSKAAHAPGHDHSDKCTASCICNIRHGNCADLRIPTVMGGITPFLLLCNSYLIH